MLLWNAPEKLSYEALMSEIISTNTSYRHLTAQVIRLSIPAILAEITSVIMQYIDAAMVGSLGKEATAAIGLVSTSSWLIGGLCISSSIGFSVQVAQLIGAKKEKDARNVLRQSIIVCMLFSFLLSGIAILISRPLPGLLGGEQSIRSDASAYFLIFALALPFEMVRMLFGSMLQSSGNMKTPGILNIFICILDVAFNYLFIYVAGLGVRGAAIGTALSEVIISLLMAYFLLFRSKTLALKLGGSWKLNRICIRNAIKIFTPIALERTVTCGAYITVTKIIAPLGNIAVAANSLAVTAESFCYMPGYGLGTAATTLVGQSIGAKRKDLAKRYAKITITLGVVIMSISAVLMYMAAPLMFMILTSEVAVRRIGTKILRIEAYAEPLYGASIVCSGVLRGAGDTLIPSIISLVSMWGVRITLSIILVPHMGLTGIWLAMCIELCFRGILMLIRTIRGSWLRKEIIGNI